MSLTTFPLTRRAALATVSAGLTAAAAGCQWGPPSTVDAPAGEADADTALVKDVTSAVAAQARLVTDTSAAHTALTTSLAPLSTLHSAHLAALTSKAVTAPAVAPAPTPEAALTTVRSGEASLQRILTTAAQDAASGPLARTLASMAAGVAMHLAALPSQVSPEAEGAA